MAITGIIAEFNPFHNGHKHLLNQAKGLKVIAMSGNFTQRGEPALVDKWTRAQLALENGADLVVELPFLVSVQSADYFAQGAITILEKVGIDCLTFGTETLLDYQNLSAIYRKEGLLMESFLQDLPKDLSYPQKAQFMWEHFAGIDFSGNTPNHILGLSYAKACAGKSISLHAIKRIGAAFHSEEKEERIASATAIRKHITDQVFIRQSMPNADLVLNSPQVTWENYMELLKYHLVINPDLTNIFQVNDELASRICRAAKNVTNVEELVDLVATKRYTKARIRRILTYILVGAKESPLPESLHVLGFSPRGQAHLAHIKDKVKLVTRIGKEAWDPITQQADQIYQLGRKEIAEQNWGRSPIRFSV